MATRSILTHQPDVSCDMCGRRLLRGERPDVFLVAGEQRTVCELCVPRASAEGWTRASEALAAASTRTPRPRRSRTLLGRLRQRHGAGAQPSSRQEPEEVDQRRGVRRQAPAPAVLRAEPEEAWQASPAPAWEADASGGTSLEPAYGGASALATDEHPHAGADLDAAAGAVGTSAVGSARHGVESDAVEIFNASECAARVAGIARALGEPSVTVRAQAEHEERVSVTVAWELCWYRYEVDLGERPATIALVADGTELDQLSPADRLANATADERGELTLLQ
jgi:hypothetical protein